MGSGCLKRLCRLHWSLQYRSIEGEGKGEGGSFVQGTFYPKDIQLGDMGVNHGCLKVFMAKEFLYRPDVISNL